MAVSAEQEQAIAAFEAVATTEERQKVGEVSDAVVSVVTAAQSIQVRTAAEAEHATEFLARLAREKRQAEEARKFLVKPLNDHVKAINERFRPTAQMLERADGMVRGKVLDYRREQERLRAEEEARLEAERRERERLAEEQRRREEAAARAAREAAAREAAAAEAQAREAARRRQEELARERSQLEQQVANADPEKLTRWAILNDDRGAAARDELERRRVAREAQEAAAAARQREDEARHAEEEARNRPLPEIPRTEVAPAAPLRAASGAISERKRWVATVEDATRVPRQYLVVDQRAINAAVKAGVREIPGVRIEHVDELAVRAS